MEPDLFWIPGPWPGKLAIAARPRGGDWLDDEADGWRRAGLDVLVSLLVPEEAARLGLARERDAAESRGLRFVSLPIPDLDVPSSLRDVLPLFRKMREALESGKNVAVHCRQGIGRSGLFAAGLLVTSGATVDKALEIVSAARGTKVPETPAQLRWIRALASEPAVL